MPLSPTGILGSVVVGTGVGAGVQFLASASPEMAVALGAGAAVLLIAGQALVPAEPELKVADTTERRSAKKDQKKKAKEQKNAKAAQEYQAIKQREQEAENKKKAEAEAKAAAAAAAAAEAEAKAAAAAAAQKEKDKKKKKKKGSEKAAEPAPAPAAAAPAPAQQQKKGGKQQAAAPAPAPAPKAAAPAPAEEAKSSKNKKKKAKRAQQQQEEEEEEEQQSPVAAAASPVAEQKRSNGVAAAAAEDDGEWEVQRGKSTKPKATKPAAAASLEASITEVENNSVTAEVKVDPKLHGRIIGPEGSQLQALQAASGAKISVPRKEEKSDKIKVTGTSDAVAAAKEAIEELATKGFASLLEPGTVNNELKIDAKHQPLVIGPKGAHIRAIQDKLKVKVMVPEKKQEVKRHVPGAPGSGSASSTSWVTLQLVGPRDSVRTARAVIRQLTEDGFSAITHEGWVRRDITIPKSEIGAVIGVKGSKIRKLQDTTHTRINIPSDTVGDDLTVTIAGLPAGIASAESEILGAVEESLKEKEDRRGPTIDDVDDPAWMDVQESEW